MEKNKKKLLYCGEFTELNTGYSVFGKNLLNYLHKTGDFDIAELACYCSPVDPRIRNVPWKVYPVLPHPNDQNGINFYNSNITYQFGSAMFEKVALDHRMDICFSIRDEWMDSYQGQSPFRRMYKWIIEPTVDSFPQNEDWINTFMGADGVFTYTDFGLDVLKKEGNGLIKLIDSAPPGVDLDTFSPAQNKAEHKAKFGFQDDIFIIGMVARNQKRKLFIDLLEAFSQFLKEAPAQLVDKTFLYLHTSYPDGGYDILRSIKKLGLSHKVLLTYFCKNCGLVFPSFFSDVRVVCPQCKQPNGYLTNVNAGLDRNSLAQIYKLFDVYVQYTIAEGISVPLLEAGACGIPLMSVDYSGCADACKKMGGSLIKVQRFFHESETGCQRALPDNSDLISKLVKILSLPESLRLKRGAETRRLTEKHYNWYATCKKWYDYLIELEITPREKTWLSPPKIHRPSSQIPPAQEMNDFDFINWAVVNVWGRPDKVGNYDAMKLLRDLTWGCTQQEIPGINFSDASLLGVRQQFAECNRNTICDKLKHLCEEANKWEIERWKLVQQGKIN